MVEILLNPTQDSYYVPFKHFESKNLVLTWFYFVPLDLHPDVQILSQFEWIVHLNFFRLWVLSYMKEGNLFSCMLYQVPGSTRFYLLGVVSDVIALLFHSAVPALFIHSYLLLSVYIFISCLYFFKDLGIFFLCTWILILCFCYTHILHTFIHCKLISWIGFSEVSDCMIK